MEKLSQAEIISAELGCNVSELKVVNGEDTVVGYLKEPNREAKRSVIDELLKSPTTAGKIYLECALIKEKSDPRLYSVLPEHDSIVLGAEMACIPLIELYQSAIKKK